MYWITKPSANDPTIRLDGLALRKGRNTTYSDISARITTTAMIETISSGHGSAPRNMVATTLVDGTIRAKTPKEMKSPWAKLISRSTPKIRPMPSAASA